MRQVCAHERQDRVLQGGPGGLGGRDGRGAGSHRAGLAGAHDRGAGRLWPARQAALREGQGRERARWLRDLHLRARGAAHARHALHGEYRGVDSPCAAAPRRCHLHRHAGAADPHEALPPRGLLLRGRRLLQLPASHLWNRNFGQLRGLQEALPRVQALAAGGRHDLRGSGGLVGLDHLHELLADHPDVGLQQLLHPEGQCLGPVEAADVALLVQPDLRRPCHVVGWNINRQTQGSGAEPPEHTDRARGVAPQLHALLLELHAHAVGHPRAELDALHTAHKVLHLEGCGRPGPRRRAYRAGGPGLLRHRLPLCSMDHQLGDCDRVLHALPPDHGVHLHQLLHHEGGLRLPCRLCRDEEARLGRAVLRDAALARPVRPARVCGAHGRRHLAPLQPPLPHDPGDGAHGLLRAPGLLPLLHQLPVGGVAIRGALHARGHPGLCRPDRCVQGTGLRPAMLPAGGAAEESDDVTGLAQT
mmetsp:Transcript_11334/g.36045  ORF Transcript_11334/g.36045 Transcript_11334/m.36045 type:complete len:474 (-) Transcript_11334:700-2121(-)